MAGVSLDRELNRDRKVRFAVASPADEAAIRRLLRDSPMQGAIRLSFEREPDYFRGANLAGGRDRTIVAYDREKLVCLGRSTSRSCWVNGCETNTGYLAELRLDRAARGRFGVLRNGYGFFHALENETHPGLYFTSIAADNAPALRLLERGVRGLPRYEFLAELDTVLIAVPQRPKRTKLQVETAGPEHLPVLLELLNAHARRHQLGVVWTAETLSSGFRIAIDGGQIIATGTLWDQRGFRQTVVRGYSPALTLARPLLNLTRRLWAGPRLPTPGLALAHAFLSPLAFASDAEMLLPDFIESFFVAAARSGIEYLTLGLPANDSRLPALRRRFSLRTWRSRLYRVSWPDAPQVMLDPDRKFLPDIALL
jgi:hypothetical protein